MVTRRLNHRIVTAGLVPAIHDLLVVVESKRNVDGRGKPGHDGGVVARLVGTI